MSVCVRVCACVCGCARVCVCARVWARVRARLIFQVHATDGQALLVQRRGNTIVDDSVYDTKKASRIHAAIKHRQIGPMNAATAVSCRDCGPMFFSLVKLHFLLGLSVLVPCVRAMSLRTARAAWRCYHYRKHSCGRFRNHNALTKLRSASVAATAVAHHNRSAHPGGSSLSDSSASVTTHHR